jgi:cellulose synthase (UDP-forming)
VRYLAWRLSSTLPPPALEWSYILAILFVAVETIAAIGGLLSQFFLARTRNRSGEADANMGWTAALPTLPLVDVLIATYNEDAQILERTIVGAQAQDYPRLRVWLLDDGRRAEIACLCAELGCGYLTRPDNDHAKAGNINAALSHLARLDETPDFVAILDADFVPMPNFVTRAMSLHKDPRVGVVQTPQNFINPDPIQQNLALNLTIPDEQRFFFDVVLSSKDAWGAAFCCGTSSVIRFAPLKAIGGFPTDSVTEDFLLSLRLKERGFGTVYLNETLSLGLAPEGLKEYLTQRGRWCLGFMQIARGRSGPLSLSSSLSLLDRLILVENFIGWSFAFAMRLLGILAPLAYFLFGFKVVVAGVDETLSHFLPFYLWQTAFLPWFSCGRQIPILWEASQLIATPTILKAVAIGLFGDRNQKFKVTAKGGDRSRRFVEWGTLHFFGALVAASLLSIAIFFRPGNSDIGGYSGLALFWTWHNLLLLTVASYICVERPRYRGAERYSTDERVILHAPDGPFPARLEDISITGAMVRGLPPAAMGATLPIEIGREKIPAQLVRLTESGFAVGFADTRATRAAMTRYFYAAGYYSSPASAHPLAVASKLFAHIFA